MENPPTSWQFNTLLVILALIILIKAYFASKKSPKNNIKTQKTTLKHLPQPKGALPFIGHLHHLCTKTTIARTLGSMADTSGPIFALRLGNQQAVVLSSSETIKDLFTNNDSLTATRPTLALSKHLAYNYASFAISPYGKYWRDIRKISTVELLSIKRLEKMKHIRNFEINSCIKNLFKTLSKYKNNKITLCKWIKYTSFNIALNMIVGKTFSHELYDDKITFASKFEKLIEKATYFSGVAVPSDFIPGIERLDLMGLIRSMKEIHHDIDLIIGHWLDEHVKKREVNMNGDGDFMDVMLSNISDGCSLYGYERDTIIKATTLTLLLTGSESTSITLTWAISLLLNNPKALKKAQEELDQKIGKQRWVEESDITNLSYLQAIVKETLRLYPPSPLAGPREAMEDCHIDGYLISKGTRIIVNIWKVHRDPRIWVRPNKFRPERFINENENIDFRRQNFEYLPFSLGRRACPGMNFGLQVVHLMLARLIQGFDICSENNDPIDMSEKLGLALPKANPLNVILKARLPSPLYESL